MILTLLYYKGNYKPPLLFTLSTSVMFVLLGMINTCLIKPEFIKDHFSHNYSSRKIIKLEVLEELNHNDFYFRYLAEVISLNNTEHQGNIIIRLKKDNMAKPLNYNELIMTNQNLTEIKASLNPGAFRFKEFMKRKGVGHQIDLHTANFIKVKNNNFRLKVSALRLRHKIIAALSQYNISRDEFSVILAILLGKRQDLSKGLIEQYKNAGALHLLAISGLHIGIVLMMLSYILKPLENFKHGKSLKLILLLLGLWAYAFLSGLSVSVIRSVGMFSALTIGILSNRSSKISNYLFISIFALLITHPLYLFDVGFQLSYSAVFAIIGISPLIKRLWEPKRKVLRYFWNLLVLSFSAQLGVLPLSLFYFHQFSGLFFISSLLIIPFLGLILGMGFLLIIADQIIILPEILLTVYESIIRLMNNIIGRISSLRSFVFEEIYFNLTLMIMSYLMLIIIMNFVKRPRPQKLFWILMCVVFIQGALIHENRSVAGSDELIVFHQYKKTIIGNRKGHDLSVYINCDSLDKKTSQMIQAYKKNYYNINVEYQHKKRNTFNFNGSKILLVDGVNWPYQINFKADIIILSNSPKINLDRFLNQFEPIVVIADATNYKTYITNWKSSCALKGYRFYETSKSGAFVKRYGS